MPDREGAPCSPGVPILGAKSYREARGGRVRSETLGRLNDNFRGTDGRWGSASLSLPGFAYTYSLVIRTTFEELFLKTGELRSFEFLALKLKFSSNPMYIFWLSRQRIK